MNIETYLDYGEILKVIFDVGDEQVDYDFICYAEDKRLSKTIIDNLKSISSFRKTENPDIYRLSINDTIFIDLSKSTGEVQSINKLTAFETRMLAQGKTKSVPFSREKKSDFSPRTDLHTHFAGALRPETLIEIGKKHDISYPIWALRMMNIDVDQYEVGADGLVKLNSISEQNIEKMKSKLMISPVTQETFNKMEEIYALRGPFTKNKELFPDYLRALANDYKKTGVEYAELSFSSFMDEKNGHEWMQMLEDNLPQIEQDTGVKLRFLAGLWRHSDKEWSLDDTDRIIQIARSPYIVGCDFMGHETNSTLEFEEELRMLARYASQEDPNFAIRVHAGENPIFKTNVYDALKTVQEEHNKLEKETGRTFPMPQVRIGHGLYGMDITQDGKYRDVPPGGVAKLIKEMGAIIEFNMSSNLALNNINDLSTVPIKRYLNEGIDVALGTDGHGMYSTVAGQETLLASAAGVEPSDFEKMKATEEKIVSRAKQREITHPKIENVPLLYENITFSTPDGQKRYTTEVKEKHKEEREHASEYLDEKISYTGAITDEQRIEEDTRGKTPIMISGASKKAWPNIHPDDQEKIAITMQVLADTLNPDTAYIVTGGTNFGAERTMHEAVHRRNLAEDKQMVLLGTFTMEAALDGEKGIEKDTITHATVLEVNGRKANNWMELPDTQLEYVFARNGCMIALGGGAIVSDMIQRSHNIGVDMHLMDGPYGASTDKSRALDGNGYSFETPEDLIQRLYSKNPELFLPSFSLDRMSRYIERAREEVGNNIVSNNPANFGMGAMARIDEMVSGIEREKGKQKLGQEMSRESKANTQNKASIDSEVSQ